MLEILIMEVMQSNVVDETNWLVFFAIQVMLVIEAMLVMKAIKVMLVLYMYCKAGQ